MYYDFLPRIKNAVRADKMSVRIPFSKMDFAIARVLAENGFIGGVEKRTFGKRHYIEIALPKNGDAASFRDFSFVSTPSRHIYRKHTELKPVRQHFGIGVLSTPKGIMTNKEARKQKVGGEYLFEIW